jgi:inorganic pyrophosphatase
MHAINLSHVDTWDPKSGSLNVVIETAKGSRNKLKYDSKRGLFQLSKVLPRGTIFPFDFGFIPSTKGQDGDPLDVLVLMDEPTCAGCLICCRLLGVIEAEQTEDGKTVRNDRLIGVAEHCQDHAEVQSVRELHETLLKEIEQFFISYNKSAGKKFRPIGHHGPKRAEKLVRKGMKRFSRKGQRAAKTHADGQATAAKNSEK